nr:hypothetical protein [Acetivibrio ethanolgignens]
MRKFNNLRNGVKMKRFITLVLAESLCSQLVIPVSYAAEVVTASELATGGSSVEVPVSATVDADFTVSLPTNIVLTGNNETKGPYVYRTKVGVKGDIASDSCVRVSPSPSVTLVDITNRFDGAGYNKKDDVVANVSQAVTEWPQAELEKTVHAVDS